MVKIKLGLRVSAGTVAVPPTQHAQPTPKVPPNRRYGYVIRDLMKVATWEGSDSAPLVTHLKRYKPKLFI